MRKDIREEDDGVILTGHFEGTHTGDLDLSAMGAGVIPSSGKNIIFPDSIGRWEVKDNKIMSEKSLGDSNAVEDFTKALGVKMPNT